MSTRILVATSAIIFAMLLASARAESIDGRVTQVALPVEDIHVSYVEAKGAVYVKLDARTASVGGTRFYVGDGKIAVELEARSSKGIFFQGRDDLLPQGSVIAKYSVIDVLPG